MKIAIGIALLVSAASAADTDLAERGKKEENFSCVQCHSLRLIHSQRLSKAAWTRELDKMAGWGAAMRDRQALLDYLSDQYSDMKPLPAPERSADGSTGRARK
jgi:mono/diheme cytochrome c family protein